MERRPSLGGALTNWLLGLLALAALCVFSQLAIRPALPFELFPGAVYLASLGLPGLLRSGGGSERPIPDFQFGVYGGSPQTMASAVRLVQPGGTDLLLQDVPWRAEPFKPPPYYGVRGIYWLPGSRFGIMADFTHIKAIAERETIVSQSGRRDGETPPQSEAVSATLGRLEFTHGYNLLTLNLVRGGGSENARMVPYAGAGLGIAVPHVEVQRAGAPRETRTYEYQIAGPAVQILAGVEWRFGRRRSVFVEYKLSCAAISGALTGGGTVGTKLCTHQFLAGPAVHVAARQPAR